MPLSPGTLATIAHWSALVPLGIVVGLAVARRPASFAWVVITLAYAVSWAADKVSDFSPEARQVAYNSYVMLAAAMIVATIASRRWVAIGLILLYALTGMYAVTQLGPTQLVPLHVVCWGSVAFLGLLEGGAAAWPLFVSFGMVLVMWLHWQRDVTSMAAFQGFLWMRILGALIASGMLLLHRRWQPAYR